MHFLIMNSKLPNTSASIGEQRSQGRLRCDQNMNQITTSGHHYIDRLTRNSGSWWIKNKRLYSLTQVNHAANARNALNAILAQHGVEDTKKSLLNQIQNYPFRPAAEKKRYCGRRTTLSRTNSRLKFAQDRRGAYKYSVRHVKK